MIEILAQDLVLPPGITGIKTYDGKPYQVWELDQENFEKLDSIPDQDWKDEWGMWRWAEGSNMGGKCNDVYVGHNEMHCFELDDPNREGNTYSSVFEYLEYELGASQPRNVCALCVDLAKMNSLSLAEFLKKFGGEG